MTTGPTPANLVGVLSNGVVAAIFLAPVVVMVGVGVSVLAVEGGDVAVIAMGATIAACASALIFAVSRGLMSLIYSDHAARYAAFAAALGGVTVRNLLGECQLRIAHPRGRVELDYRSVRVGSDEGGDPFTRVALACAPGSLPARRIDMVLGAGQPELGPAARQAVAALGVAFGPETRVHLRGRGGAPHVAVLVRGWVQDIEAARRCVELARPQLEALASAAWAA